MTIEQFGHLLVFFVQAFVIIWFFLIIFKVMLDGVYENEETNINKFPLAGKQYKIVNGKFIEIKRDNQH